MVSHWSLSDSKFPQVSTTLLNILVDLSNAVVWMVFTRPLISKCPSPRINLLVTVPRVPITIPITVTSMFHIFFRSLIKSKYLSFFSFSFSFTQWSAGTAKSNIQQVLFFFFFFLTKSGRLAKNRWSVYYYYLFILCFLGSFLLSFVFQWCIYRTNVFSLVYQPLNHVRYVRWLLINRLC